MTDYSNTQYTELPIEETNPHHINQRNRYDEINLPESEAQLPYQHSSRSSNGHSNHTNHPLSLDQAISHARDAQAAPIIPINSVGTGAHDNCSATCILSHPRRSATIYVCILVAITCLVTGSLIGLKAFRGDVPGAHVNPSVADQTPVEQIDTVTSESVMIVDIANNVTIIDQVINQTTSTGIPLIPETVYDRIDRAIHSAVPTLQSANPKVPIDEDDMTSSMLLLLWGLSPLVSAVATISWTYLRYRKSITVPSEEAANRSDLILEPSSLVRDTSELRLHHHHPMFVNPSPRGQEDEDEESQSQQADELYDPENNQIDQPLPSNDNLIAINQRSSSQSETIISPPPSRPIRASTVGHSVIAQPLLSPNSRAVSEPMSLIPEPGPMARTVSAQGCPRPHRVAPFYSRPKKDRGWFWWVPRSRAQLSTLLRPFGRFLLRCYFLPIMVPTIGAVLQYAFACCAGYTGFLSPTFVPMLTSALSLPSTKTAELWSVTLAFFYELFFGVWWDPFPPGSADWGRGMDFSGASWMAISAMEEIGWAGLLFPCLYEIWPKNPTRASIVTGLIWSAWHWPMLVFGQMNLFPEAAAYHPGLLSTPFLYGFITFTLSTTFSRVIMVRLLLFSDDLWSQCVYHAAHNVMVFNFFAQLPDVDSSRYPHAGLFIAEAGIPLVLMYMSLACVIIYRWRTAERRKTRSLAASHGIILADGEAISPAHNQMIAQIIDQSDTPEDLQFYPRSKSPDEVQMQARLSLLSPVTEESARYQSFSSRRSSQSSSATVAS